MPCQKFPPQSRARKLPGVIALALAALLALVEGSQGALAQEALTVTALQDAAAGPFQSSRLRVAAGPLTRTWQTVKAGVVADLAALAMCRARAETCSPAAGALLRIIAEGRARDGLARIGVINRAVNLAIKPVDDPFGWRSALETLSAGNGDCKDYAVTKYVALLEAGFAEQDVKIAVVHDMAANQDHAVVTVRFNGDWIVLDNRWLALLRDDELRRAVPLYVLDENGASRFRREVAKSSLPSNSPARAAAAN